MNELLILMTVTSTNVCSNLVNQDYIDNRCEHFRESTPITQTFWGWLNLEIPLLAQVQNYPDWLSMYSHSPHNKQLGDN